MYIDNRPASNIVLPYQGGFTLSFQHGGVTIGRLTLAGNALHFEGEADASARVLFEHALKDIVDGYIREKTGA